ncbi:MAG: GNAT family N-acetyltransferase [Nitrospirae bacterium]|nr:GNAT family N-acetyltransferase [Nitrospirota bacterium]
MADVDDIELLWQWRNDPVVRQHSFNSDPIPWATHQRWCSQKMSSSSTKIYTLEDSGKPVGQIRYERMNDATAEIGGISIATEERGKGYGKTILTQTIPIVTADLKVKNLTALVKEENIASARMFLSSGFYLNGQVTKHGYVCSHFIVSCSDR